MNTISRGIRNAFRNVIRTGSIVVILSISIGLIIAMLAARQAVETKIENVKSSVGNTVSISPAGFHGFEGGGTALTAAEITKVKAVANVTSVTSSLSARLSSTTTSLTSGITAGTLGLNSSTSSTATNSTNNSQAPPSGENPMSRITITGVDSTSSVSTFGGSSLTWTSGNSFDASADTNNAVVGTVIASANNLTVGSTFTAYGTTMTVVGIYDAGTQFANNGVFVSLSALQRLSSQADSITSAIATVNSVDNLTTATTAIKDTLGTDVADVTNNQETVSSVVAPLESVKTISLYSLIGSLIAGSVIILLTMIMIVRERRREVGVMKAVGASNVGIMGQFVVEALTLTVLGLIVGTAIGIFASAPLADMLVSTSSSSTTSTMGPGGPGRMMQSGLRGATANIQSSVGVTALLAGAGATLLIAILGSAIPSLMISKIKPAEAMRSE